MDHKNYQADTRVFVLSGLADCADPDSPESPGADFLRRIAESFAEAVTYQDERPSREDLHDLCHEVADGAVPIYTHTLWKTFVDVAAYTEDLDDLGGSTGDMTKDATASLYMIADRLCHALAEALADEIDSDDEDSDGDDDV